MASSVLCTAMNVGTSHKTWALFVAPSIARSAPMQLHPRSFAQPAQILHNQLRVRGACASWEIRWCVLQVTIEEPSHQGVLSRGERCERSLRSQLATQHWNAGQFGQIRNSTVPNARYDEPVPVGPEPGPSQQLI